MSQGKAADRDGRPAIQPRRHRQRPPDAGARRSGRALLRTRLGARPFKRTVGRGEMGRQSCASTQRPEQWDEAERFHRESLNLQQPFNDSDSPAYAKLDAARIASGRGQHEQAIRLYEETIALARRQRRAHLGRERRLGEEYRALGAPEKASILFERCLQHHRRDARTRLSTSRLQAHVLLASDSGLSAVRRRARDERRLRKGAAGRRFEPRAALSEGLQLDGRRAPMTRAGLQRTARKLNVIFLSYWLAPDRSFLWVVSGQTFDLLELPRARSDCRAGRGVSRVHRNERARSDRRRLPAGARAVRHAPRASSFARPRRLPRRRRS